MEPKLKKKVIQLHKRNFSNTEIASRLDLSKSAVSRCISNYNKKGPDFYKSKPGNKRGLLRLMTPEQLLEFEDWLVEQELLTAVEIRSKWEHITGKSVSVQIANNFLKRFLSPDMTNYLRRLRKVQIFKDLNILLLLWGEYGHIKLLMSSGKPKYSYYYFFRGNHTVYQAKTFFSLLDKKIPTFLPADKQKDVIFAVSPELHKNFKDPIMKLYYSTEDYSKRFICTFNINNNYFEPDLIYPPNKKTR